MSYADIMKKRRMGLVEEIKEENVTLDGLENIIPTIENFESAIIQKDMNDEMKTTEFNDELGNVNSIDIEMNLDNVENVTENLDTSSNTNMTVNILEAKDKILSTNHLGNLIEGIKFFEKQANYSFFFLAHCFYKIREDLLYKQEGYANFTDFIKIQLKDYSYRSVYNFLSVAEAFSLTDTDSSILDLGMSKLILISSIKEKSVREEYLQNNISEIANMSSREMRQRVSEMNKVDTIVILPDNFEHNFKNNVVQLKDKVMQFGSFLNSLDIIENDNYERLKNEIITMEEMIREVKGKIILRLQQ